MAGWCASKAPIAAAPTKSTRKTTTSAARRRWTSTSPAMPTISRDSPMVVTYDANSRSFYCGFMGGRSIVRLNGMPLLSTTQLKHGDIIELGKTKLMFVPFSSDAFDWDWTQE